MSNNLIKHHIVPTLLTPRLRIRAVEAKDAPALYQIRSDLENLKFVEITPYEDIERANKFVKNVE